MTNQQHIRSIIAHLHFKAQIYKPSIFFSMNDLSFWEKQSFLSGYYVAIIGSGIVGVSAALRLKELDKKLNVVIIERGVLPLGASTRNAGFACFGSMTELLDDLQHHSEAEVFGLLEKRWQGLRKLRERVGDRNMEYHNWGGYEIFTAQEQDNFQMCADKIPFFNQALATIIGQKDVFSIKKQKFGFRNTKNLIFNRAEGQLDTGKMMATLINLAMKKGIRFLNATEVIHLEESNNHVLLHTNNDFAIAAQQTLIVNNAFARQLLPEIDVFPARNQVLITKPIPNLSIKGCFHYDKGYVYFRNVGSRLLLGGGRNHDFEGEQTAQLGNTPHIQQYLLDLLENVILPQQKIEIDSWWSGIIGVGKQKQPIIKRISPRVGVAVRCGGMGVAMGSLTGEEAADMIHE
jgi:gamma-glutamylputrescine oxidase